MKYIKNYVTLGILSFIFIFMLVNTASVFAYEGNWKSGTYKDWDGSSKVQTTYTGGGGDAVAVD